jgi:hypothetical protein
VQKELHILTSYEHGTDLLSDVDVYSRMVGSTEAQKEERRKLANDLMRFVNDAFGVGEDDTDGGNEAGNELTPEGTATSEPPLADVPYHEPPLVTTPTPEPSYATTPTLEPTPATAKPLEPSLATTSSPTPSLDAMPTPEQSDETNNAGDPFEPEELINNPQDGITPVILFVSLTILIAIIIIITKKRIRH